MQSKLQDKLNHTNNVIDCWIESFTTDGAYVAFSGGLDSTVLLDIVRKRYPDIPAVFNNTGLELPEIVKFVKTFDNVVILRPKKPFHQVIKEYGWPVISKEQSQFIYEWRTTRSDKLRDLRWNGRPNGRSKISEIWKPVALNAPFKISHKCCDVLKKNPAKAYEKKTGRLPMLGIMAGEGALRSMNHSCNRYDTKRPTSRPLLKWTKEDIWEYIRENNLPYCSVYDNGWERTGCTFCMYGIHKDEVNRFQLMKTSHPQLYKYCIEKLGAGEVLDFMGIDYYKNEPTKRQDLVLPRISDED